MLQTGVLRRAGWDGFEAQAILNRQAALGSVENHRECGGGGGGEVDVCRKALIGFVGAQGHLLKILSLQRKFVPFTDIVSSVRPGSNVMDNTLDLDHDAQQRHQLCASLPASSISEVP
jgi:hypothetical protein